MHCSGTCRTETEVWLWYWDAITVTFHAIGSFKTLVLTLTFLEFGFIWFHRHCCQYIVCVWYKKQTLKLSICKVLKESLVVFLTDSIYGVTPPPTIRNVYLLVGTIGGSVIDIPLVVSSNHCFSQWMCKMRLVFLESSTQCNVISKKSLIFNWNYVFFLCW